MERAAEEIARLLEMTAGRVREALEDLSAEELIARPQGLAPALWQLGHMAYHEADMARRAGRAVSMPDGYEKLFARGSSGDGPFPGLGEVAEFAARANGLLVELAGSGLDRPAPSLSGSYGTVGEGLVFMLYHRGYHHGKIMTLRALLGKRRLLG